MTTQRRRSVLSLTSQYLFLNSLESSAEQVYCGLCHVYFAPKDFDAMRTYHEGHALQFDAVRPTHVHCRECSALYSAKYFVDVTGGELVAHVSTTNRPACTGHVKRSYELAVSTAPRPANQKASIWCCLCNTFIKHHVFKNANRISLHVFGGLSCDAKAFLLHYSTEHATQLCADLEYNGSIQSWEFILNYYTQECHRIETIRMIQNTNRFASILPSITFK
jgi:hypothetical protein